jgi:hypothetical protein
MEFHKFSKKSIAIFAVFALILLGLVVKDFSPMVNLVVIVVSAVVTASAVTRIEEKWEYN